MCVRCFSAMRFFWYSDYDEITAMMRFSLNLLKVARSTFYFKRSDFLEAIQKLCFMTL